MTCIGDKTQILEQQNCVYCLNLIHVYNYKITVLELAHSVCFFLIESLNRIRIRYRHNKTHVVLC